MVIHTIRCTVPQCFLLTGQKTFNTTPQLRDDVCYPTASYGTSTEPLVGRWQRFQRYISNWRPLRIGAFGLVLVVAAFQWRQRSQPENQVAKKWEVTCYRMIPLRASSRAWGWLTNLELPRLIRPWVYGFYADMFGCKIHEAEVEDLYCYPSLSDFFCRQLKENARPIDPIRSIISPADGRILNFGRVDGCHVDQVKGIKYSIPAFLGEPTWRRTKDFQNSGGDAKVTYDPTKVDWNEYKKQLLQNKDTDLYQCVVYLAPGDYHRFHSPAQWTVNFRRHFQGDLLSVSPRIAKWIPDLFSLNERAVYVGSWKHGFFSFGAVGATNVGNIRVICDESLHTNMPKWPRGQPLQRDAFLGSPEKGIPFKKGELFGEFRLGSTIVLLFEAPKDFMFDLEKGQKIEVGSALSKLSK
ncbi:phosphatidylserine decarboxylase proenzyme, mitochondrial [Frankliniella occidentalis]|uniref:Phosphatidylserine decarboxylase proenzyme, mitochondrial n=1 Tax=Frankliniella occidentalis TaxID=133901 RepID=A0A6J1SJR4_FRAOC|nr:phosphatidylserine decarboxylase proenzyme, mitochondrial [Frankliniella occidentalis]